MGGDRYSELTVQLGRHMYISCLSWPLPMFLV